MLDIETLKRKDDRNGLVVYGVLAPLSTIFQFYLVEETRGGSRGVHPACAP
jgi:hypothetical protein